MPSAETIAELEAKLAEANRGDLVGLAYIAIYRKAYVVNSVGQANKNPTLTRAMALELIDLLRDRARHPRD